MVYFQLVDSSKTEEILQYKKDFWEKIDHLTEDDLKIFDIFKVIVSFAESFRLSTAKDENLFSHIAYEAFHVIGRFKYFLRGETNIFKSFEKMRMILEAFELPKLDSYPAASHEYLTIWRDIFKISNEIGRLVLMASKICINILNHVKICIKDIFLKTIATTKWKRIDSGKKALFAKELYLSIHAANNVWSYFDKALLLLSNVISRRLKAMVAISGLGDDLKEWKIESQKILMGMKLFAVDSKDMIRAEEMLEETLVDNNNNIFDMRLLEKELGKTTMRMNDVVIGSKEQIKYILSKSHMSDFVKDNFFWRYEEKHSALADELAREEAESKAADHKH